MIVIYKYPIFPDSVTQQTLAEALDACRWIHRLLQELKEAKERDIELKIYDTQNMIPLLKLNPKLNLIHSKVLQMVALIHMMTCQKRHWSCYALLANEWVISATSLYILQVARDIRAQMVNYTLLSNIKGLSASKNNGQKIGHVRFKGPGWYKTMNSNQSGFRLDQDHGRLHLSKTGDIKIKIHRMVQGLIKAIKREGNQWSAIVQADQEPEPLPETGRCVRLDFGLKSFVVDTGNDTGNNSVETPGFAEKVATKVKNIHRRLSRAEKGSKNRQKLIDKLNKVNYKIKNQRNDFLHKLSRRHVNNYDIICVEDLDVKRMKERGHNKSMHRDIHDASWYRFIFMLSYKAESAGRRLIEAIPMNTTQRLPVEALQKKSYQTGFMSVLAVDSRVIETAMLPGTYSSQGWNSP